MVFISDCMDPTSSLSTGYVPDATTPTVYESEISISCDIGYTGSPGSITCQADAFWSTGSGCSPVGEYMSSNLTCQPTLQYLKGLCEPRHEKTCF